MRANIAAWCHNCSICASRSVGPATRPHLTTIPAADHIEIDFIKFPKSEKGTQYVIVFVDYLTKWPDIFAMKDQSSVTVAKLLVEHIISRFGVPAELLSDRGNFVKFDVWGLLSDGYQES